MTVFQKYSALIFVVMILIAVYYLQAILTPFLVGMILAYLGDPVVDRLEQQRVNRTMAVLIVFVIFLLLLVGMAVVVIPVLLDEVSVLSLIHI